MKYQANPVVVDAFQIVNVGGIQSDGSRHVATQEGTNRLASKEMLARYAPVHGDYWVIQEDGYEYVNPKDVFERKYSPVQVRFDIVNNRNVPVPLDSVDV